MTVGVTTKIELSGEFFRRDPRKTIKQNIAAMLSALAKELEGAVREDISSHAGSMPDYSGWSWAHTLGYTTSARTGKHWAYWAAVGAVTTGMSAKDAIRTKAAAATIERRWHPYRRAKSAVFRSRALISADLTKGLE